MINQVNNSSASKNIFTPLQNNGSSYAITKPFTEEQKREQEKHNRKRESKLGFKIAEIALFAGFSVLLLVKGASKNFRGKVTELIKKMQKKNATQKTTESFKRVTKTLEKYSKSTFNFAPLKDVLFKKFSQKIPFLNKINTRITEIFEMISVKTSKASYSSTLSRFDDLYGNFKAIKTKIKPSKEDEKIINSYLENIRNHYSNSFDQEARRQRLASAKADMGDIAEKVWKKTYHDAKGYLKNKDNYQLFVSEELAADAKLKLHNEIFEQKDIITSTYKDRYIYIKKLMFNIESKYLPKDEETIKLVDGIKENIEQYGKAGAPQYKAKILEHLNKLESVIPDKDIAESIKRGITLFSKEENKGEIQNLMEIYRKYMAEEDYKKLSKNVSSFSRSLNKSVDLETDKLFDKVRDLLIGSAPLDVLSILSSLGVVGFGLTLADNKDQRISVALKYGIPAVGAVSVSLLCTLGLISGGPSLIIGLISGLAINKLGEVLDKKRKEYQEINKIAKVPDKIISGIKNTVLTQNKSSL